ncbi:ABC transporter ATP-binding protein [Vampirovibrio chlorellavorus]|uniref:ABC transporter ATP-binding protein n=1 Tax=Vampirovibrio chlorellavorus TaxID=758823 RepID=UPI0026EB4763|nr:ABC transporter ATP-binding protein [Vampirovibrio chlorellavorus]
MSAPSIQSEQSSPSVPPQPFIRLEKVSKHFPIHKGFFNRKVGEVQAVTEIDLEIYAGETLGVVGESGCGKSTLGRSILQLLRPSGGRVLLDGIDLCTLSNRQLQPLRREMQIVFQNPYSSLDPRMTIGETVAEPLQVHHLYKGPALTRRVAELLDMVGLPRDAFRRYPHEFSGGQRQRVGIARAIALNPRFIVADEPVSALDVSVQAQILNLMDDLKKEFKLTYLFIAHNLSVVEYISDRVAVMYLGKIVEIAPAASLYHQPLHPYTKALLSAIPVPDPTVDLSKRVLLQGDLPSPSNPPSGCRFHTRCPYVVDKCKTEVPAGIEYLPGHVAYCHRVLEINALPPSL